MDKIIIEVPVDFLEPGKCVKCQKEGEVWHNDHLCYDCGADKAFPNSEEK